MQHHVTPNFQDYKDWKWCHLSFKWLLPTRVDVTSVFFFLIGWILSAVFFAQNADGRTRNKPVRLNSIGRNVFCFFSQQRFTKVILVCSMCNFITVLHTVATFFLLHNHSHFCLLYLCDNHKLNDIGATGKHPNHVTLAIKPSTRDTTKLPHVTQASCHLSPNKKSCNHQTPPWLDMLFSRNNLWSIKIWLCVSLCHTLKYRSK